MNDTLSKLATTLDRDRRELVLLTAPEAPKGLRATPTTREECTTLLRYLDTLGMLDLKCLALAACMHGEHPQQSILWHYVNPPRWDDSVRDHFDEHLPTKAKKLEKLLTNEGLV